MKSEWIYVPKGTGRQVEENGVSKYKRNFSDNAVGRIVDEFHEKGVHVWLVGLNQHWIVERDNVKSLDVTKTGDKHKYKICNVCLCRLPVGSFAPNQTNKHGMVRRPTCKRCRTDIDKRPPKSSQAKKMERQKPQKGDLFTCPICCKRSIAGVTAKIVADHDHHTGNIRDFICDSCNTGLGRFKNGENYLQNAIDYLNQRDSLAE